MALDWMFTRTTCLGITSYVPEYNKDAGHYAKANGFRYTILRKEAITKNNNKWDVQYYYLDVADWFFKHTKSYTDKGRKFHAQLSKQLEREDETVAIADRLVGITLQMFQNGMMSKGLSLFNHIAPLIGHATIQLLGQSPQWAYIAMDNAVIRVDHGMNVEVLEVL
jgi:hypothetical protein